MKLMMDPTYNAGTHEEQDQLQNAYKHCKTSQNLFVIQCIHLMQ